MTSDECDLLLHHDMRIMEDSIELHPSDNDIFQLYHCTGSTMDAVMRYYREQACASVAAVGSTGFRAVNVFDVVHREASVDEHHKPPVGMQLSAQFAPGIGTCSSAKMSHNLMHLLSRSACKLTSKQICRYLACGAGYR